MVDCISSSFSGKLPKPQDMVIELGWPINFQCQRFQQFEGRILQRSLFRPKRMTKILEKRSGEAIVHFVDCSLVYCGRRDNRKRCFVDDTFLLNPFTDES